MTKQFPNFLKNLIVFIQPIVLSAKPSRAQPVSVNLMASIYWIWIVSNLIFLLWNAKKKKNWFIIAGIKKLWTSIHFSINLVVLPWFWLGGKSYIREILCKTTGSTFHVLMIFCEIETYTGSHTLMPFCLQLDIVTPTWCMLVRNRWVNWWPAPASSTTRWSSMPSASSRLCQISSVFASS